MMHHARYWLLYDGDCRICTLAARWAGRLDVRRRIHIQPIQQSRELLRSLPRDEILDAMHVVSPNGRVTTGGDSLPALIEALFGGPALGSIVRASPGLKASLNRLYAVMAEFRGHLVCRYEALAFPLPVGRSGNAGS